MESFGATVFTVMREGAGRGKSAVITEMHIPDSDVNIIDVGGQLATHRRYNLLFDSEVEYITFEGLVGTLATLILGEGRYTSTLLVSARETLRAADKRATFADAEFILGTLA